MRKFSDSPESSGGGAAIVSPATTPLKITLTECLCGTGSWFSSRAGTVALFRAQSSTPRSADCVEHCVDSGGVVRRSHDGEADLLAGRTRCAGPRAAIGGLDEWFKRLKAHQHIADVCTRSRRTPYNSRRWCNKLLSART